MYVHGHEPPLGSLGADWCTVFAAVTGRISGPSNHAQRSWIERIQERLRLTSSMLGDMKAVKTLGLSDKMFSIVQGMRMMEIETSERFRKLLIWQLILCKNGTTILLFENLITDGMVPCSQFSEPDSSCIHLCSLRHHRLG